MTWAARNVSVGGELVVPWRITPTVGVEGRERSSDELVGTFKRFFKDKLSGLVFEHESPEGGLLIDLRFRTTISGVEGSSFLLFLSLDFFFCFLTLGFAHEDSL